MEDAKIDLISKNHTEIRNLLQQVSSSIKERTENAKNLAVTENSLMSAKKLRAALNKEFGEWERRRKLFKQSIIDPYEKFLELYKVFIGKHYKQADEELKSKINEIENFLKIEKSAEVFDYFKEYAESIGLKDYPDVKLIIDKINLSESVKSVKLSARKKAQIIKSVYLAVQSMENGDEIWFEYKKDMDFPNAIKIVTDRKRAIKETEFKKSIQNEIIRPIIEDSEELTVNFTVTATKVRLKELKKWLTDHQYKFK